MHAGGQGFDSLILHKLILNCRSLTSKIKLNKFFDILESNIIENRKGYFYFFKIEIIRLLKKVNKGVW